MGTVVLRNGATAALSLVSVTMLSLKNLMETKPMVFYELVMVCRDSTHKIWGEDMECDLVDLALLQTDGLPHDSIKNIVLSAVEGEGLNLTIGNPVKPTGDLFERVLNKHGLKPEE